MLVSVPLIAAAQLYAAPLIDLLTDDPAAIEQGSIYLRIVTYALLFRFWSMIAARALQGSGDTRTPMYVNLITVPTNIGLNAALIFGLGPFPRLGIAGAAWGTAIAETLSAGLFFALLVGGDYGVSLRLGGKQWDTSLAREIVRVGAPLAGTRLVGTFGRFPFLFVLSVGSASIAPGLGLGVVAIFAAIVLDFYIQAGVTTARFWSGKWQIVARRAEGGPTPSDD